MKSTPVHGNCYKITVNSNSIIVNTFADRLIPHNVSLSVAIPIHKNANGKHAFVNAMQNIQTHSSVY